MKHKLTLVIFATLIATHVYAQTPPGDAAAAAKAFEVSAAPQPEPAMKYVLLPRVYEQIPGPAAPLYFNAMFNIPEYITVDGKQKSFYGMLDEYEEMPLKALKDSDAAENLSSSVMSLLEQGSLRDRAGWETTVRQDGFAALLPYLSHVRMASKFVVAKSRLQLANGDVDAALRSARVLFAMTKHLKDDPFLIQMLVGAAVTELGLEKVIEPVVKTPGAPNLYWALADLPRPYCDLGNSIEWERAGVYWSMPSLRGRRPEELSADEWTTALRELTQMTTNASSPKSELQLEETAMAVAYYGRAKQHLIDTGTPAETVNAMPVAQVIGLATLGSYNHWLDEMGKWLKTPYWQGSIRIREAEQRMDLARAEDPLNLAYLAIPSLKKAYAVSARLDRHIAALQSVEAIRAFAATNGGHLPASLAEIVDTPAPLDPITGKLFEYRVTGDKTAEISSPAIPGSAKPEDLHYAITLR